MCLKYRTTASFRPRSRLNCRRSERDAASSSVPVGLAISADGKTLFAALNLKNTLAEIDLATGKLRREIPVGNAPYDVVLVRGHAYVSNWAGRLPTGDSTTGPSGVAPPVRVDPVRNIANDGSVSVVDLEKGRQIAQIVVGLHPSGMVATPDGNHVLVANASSDTMSVIDTHDSTKLSRRFRQDRRRNCRSAARRMHWRSAPTGAGCMRRTARTTRSPSSISRRRIASCLGACRRAGIRRGWRSTRRAERCTSRTSRELARGIVRGKGSERSTAMSCSATTRTISRERCRSSSCRQTRSWPSTRRVVLANNRLKEIENAFAPPRPNVPPRPVPERHGEPSVFKHVVYIIKENRTYDQVLGDVKKGEGDP